MLLKTVLEQNNFASFLIMLSQSRVIYFQANEYPILFFSLLLQVFKKNNIRVQHIDMQQLSLSQIKNQLEMSFLGNTTLYWLGNISEQQASIKKEIMAYCSAYKGPNKLMLFVSDESSIKIRDNYAVVELPQEVDQQLFVRIAQQMVGDESTSYNEFAVHLYKNYTAISLDTACLLMYYALVWDANQRSFFDYWIDELIASPQSLFNLSQYFFAGKATLFFEQWKHIAHLYSPQFWCSFWSDQLWRAYHYIYFNERKDMKAARAIGFRLPFSFLRKDWQFISRAAVQEAHQRITDIDFALKNGSDAGILDLFYSQFLHMLSQV